MLTVEDVWQSALPAGTQLAGGLGGLGRQVTWAERMVPRPPGFKGLKGGELAILSIETVKALDPRLTVAELMKRLVSRNIAGLIVLGEITDEDSATADEVNIPLLTLPQGTDLYELQQTITRLVTDRRTDVYRQGQEIFMQLAQLAIDGQGLPGITRRLSAITQKTVAFEIDGGPIQILGPLAPANSTSDALMKVKIEGAREAIQTWVRSMATSSSESTYEKFDLDGDGLACLVSPVQVKGQTRGIVAVLGAADAMSDLDKLAVTRGAAACGMALARDAAVLEVQDRLQGDFVEELLTGTSADFDALLSRGKRLGYTLKPPYAVVAFEIAGKPNARPEGAPLGEFVPTVETPGGQVLYRAKGNSFEMLIPADDTVDPKTLKDIAESNKKRLSVHLQGAKMTVGIGRIHPGLEGIRIGHQEAIQALAIGAHLRSQRGAAYFGDLGIYRLLFNLRDIEDTRAFYQETMGKLLEYDQKSGGELVKTLQAYFDCNSSIALASDHLCLHRNSMQYRLRRIEEITGMSLNDPERCLEMQVALRIGEMLQVTTGES